MRDIPRESPSEKVEGLMVNSNELYDEMEHLAYLKTLVFNFSSDRLNLVRDLSTIIGFLINISMVATYALVLDDQKEMTAKYNKRIIFLHNSQIVY